MALNRRIQADVRFAAVAAEGGAVGSTGQGKGKALAYNRTYWAGLVLGIGHVVHFADWEAVCKAGEDWGLVGETETDVCDVGAGEASVVASG